MKKAPIYILLILFLCTAGLYSAEISDTKDSTKVRKKKEVYLVAIGGAGLGWAGYMWNYTNKFIPSIVLGLELPFTRSHIFAFEVIVHEWLATQRLDAYFDESSKYFAKNSIKIGKTTYTDIGISHALKWYVTKQTSKFRVSVHLGAMLTNLSHFELDKPYINCDIGFAIFYPIDDNLTLSLSQRIFIGESSIYNSIAIGGGKSPNLLTLNLNYKFKL